MYQLQTLSLGNGELGRQVHLTGSFIMGWYSRLIEFHHNNCGTQLVCTLPKALES
jgi:hypothetical protein